MFLRFITLSSDVEIFSAMQWYFFSRELMFIYLPQRLIEMLKVISLPKSIVNNESIKQQSNPRGIPEYGKFSGK